MAEAKKVVSAFARVVGSTTGDDLTLLRVETFEKKVLTLPFASECIPMAVAALSGRPRTSTDHHPGAMTPTLQGIRIEGFQTAMKDDGTLSLLLVMEGGGLVLPIEMPASVIQSLARELGDLAALSDPSRQN